MMIDESYSTSNCTRTLWYNIYERTNIADQKKLSNEFSYLVLTRNNPNFIATINIFLIESFKSTIDPICKFISEKFVLN